MKQQTKKRKQFKGQEFFKNVQTENKRGNMAVFLTDATLFMQAETWLIKPQKLPLVS